MVLNSQQQGFNLGNAHGKVILTTNAAEAMQQAQREVQNGVRGIGASLQNIGGGLSNMGGAMTAWTAPIAAVGAVGIKTAASYESAMTNIAARTGLAGEELEKIRQKTLELGSETKFSSQQAADAFLQLVTAGLTTEQAYDAVDSVLLAATASGEDLGRMADQVTNVMSAFQLEASDTASIVEFMNSAAAASPSTMGQMGEALADVGGLAKSYGMDLETTSSVLAIFAKANIRGTEASTKLRSMLDAMNAGTERSEGAWNALGTSLFDANGNARDFADVIEDVKKGLQGKTEAEKTRIIKDLAGSYGLSAFNALLASDGIDEMRQTLSEQATAAEVAAKQEEAFEYQLISLMGSIERLNINFFTPFMNDVLKPFVKQVIDIVNHMANWAEANPQVTKTIAGLMSIVLGLGPALFIAGKAVTLIGILVGALASPIALVAGAISALVAAFMADFAGIRTFLIPILEQIWQGINRIGFAIRAFVSDFQNYGIAEAIRGIFGTGTDERAESTLEGVLVAFGMSRKHAIQAVDFLVSIIANIEKQLRKLYTIFRLFKVSLRSLGLVRTINLVFGDKVAGVIEKFVKVIDRAKEGIRSIYNAIGFFVADMQNFGLAEAIAGIFGTGSYGETEQGSLEGVLVAFGLSRDNAISVVDFLVGIFTSVRDTISSVVETLRPLFVQVGEFLGNIFASVDPEKLFQIGRILLSLTSPIGIVLTALQALGVDLGQVFQEGVAGVTRFFEALNNGGTVFDGLRAAFGESGFIDALETGLNNAITFIHTVVLPGLQTLANWFMVDVLPGVISFIQTTIIPGVQSFIDILKKVWTDVSPFLGFLFNWFITTGLPLIIDFINVGVIPAVQTFVDILTGIWIAVSPALTALYDWFITSGLPAIRDFIAGPFTLALISIRDFLAGFWASVKVGVELFRDKLKEIMQWITDNVLQPFLDFLTSLIDTINSIPETINNAIGGYQQAGQGIQAIAQATPEQRANLDIWGAIRTAFPSRDNGGHGLAGQPYYIGKGAQPEVFIPENNGTFIPNIDKLLAGAGGGMTINGDIVVQGASSYSEGRQAGQGALDAIMERYRERGN